MRHVTASLLASLLVSSVAMAQAPAAGSGAGGPVGPSVSQPTAPTAATPPGAAATPTQRDAAGQAVIGKTGPDDKPAASAPGTTNGADSGGTKP